MGWFSNLFNNETVSRAITYQDAVSADEPYSAVREKITNGKINQQITIIRELIMNLPITSSQRSRYLRSVSVNYYGSARPWPHRNEICSLLSLLSTSLTHVDVPRADMKTLFRLIDLCNTTLPSMVRDLEIRIGQKDWGTEAETLKLMETAVKEMLAEIALLPTTRSILNLEVPQDGPDEKNFPAIESYENNAELYAALQALKTDWDKASRLPLSAEDNYVIERVGNSYLPDALLLFDRFCHRTGATNSGKALSIVKEQVELIHQQVAFVLEQHEEDSFNLMETHTEFLKMKSARIGASENKENSGLDLEGIPPKSSS